VTHNDFQFGLKPASVRRTLSVVVRMFVLAEKTRTNEDVVELFDGISEAASVATDERDRWDSKLTDLISLQHAEISFICLTLESLAFLTDEQQFELREANSKRLQSWRNILDVCFAETMKISADEITVRRADALFLTQMEWMRDAGFESCSRGERLRIFSESPIAYELSRI
jgi:hypothetical protein